MLWAGTDDGLVHISEDGGKNWRNITPPDLPEWALISIIEVSPHEEGVAYVAATRYKHDDTKPYLSKRPTAANLDDDHQRHPGRRLHPGDP